MRIIFLSVIIPVFVLAQGWPLSPQNQVHPVGNNWGEYQEYGSGPYLHNGVDVMGVTTGQPVYAVGRGTVKAWLTIQADYHWRLAIGDSHRIPTDSCDGWLYAHIDRNRFHLNVGDTCRPGDLIGYLVVWPTTGFDHCHWARIRNAGYPWQSNWLFVQNPLWVVRPNIDSFPPIFENARGSERFAFCRNNTSTYLASNNLNGDVDIIIKVLDKTCRPWRDTVWTRLIPYKIEYRMRGPVNIPTTRFMEFRGKLLWDAAATNTIYKDDGTCNTRGDYSYRDYFFIITNTDGDTLIEPTDTAGKWQTQNYPDGNYWVVVTAYDAYGNARAESMLVTLRNGNKVEGNTLDGLTGHFSITPTVVPSQKAVKINRSKEIVKPCRLNIFDVTGKKVFAASIPTHSAEPVYIIPARIGLAPGVYFLRVVLKDLIYEKKLIVVE